MLTEGDQKLRDDAEAFVQDMAKSITQTTTGIPPRPIIEERTQFVSSVQHSEPDEQEQT